MNEQRLRFKGYSFYPNKQKYKAMIVHNGVKYRSSYFSTRKEAADWYINKARELGVEDAKLDAIPDGWEDGAE